MKTHFNLKNKTKIYRSTQIYLLQEHFQLILGPGLIVAELAIYCYRVVLLSRQIYIKYFNIEQLNALIVFMEAALTLVIALPNLYNARLRYFNYLVQIYMACQSQFSLGIRSYVRNSEPIDLIVSYTHRSMLM